MGLTTFFSDDSDPSVIEADDTLATDLYDRSRDARLQTVRPYKNTENGLERGMKLLTALHDPNTGMLGMRNKSEPFAFELHYGAETELLQSRVATKSDERFELVDRQVQSHYADSDTREVDPAFLEIQPGQYVSGTTLQLRQREEFERLRPIRNFRLDPEHFEIGPFRSIAREMVGAAHRPDCDVLVQSVIKPAVSTAKWDRNNWWYGIDQTIDSVTGKDSGGSMDWGEVGKSIAEPFQRAGMTERQRRREERRQIREQERNGGSSGSRFTGTGEEPTASRSDVAQLLDQQRGMRGYHLCIRIIAVSDDREEAQKRVQDTAGMFRNFYDSRFQQGFVPVNPSGKKLHRVLQHAASREYTDRKMTFPVDTLTGVCKIPTDLALQQFDHSMSAAGQGVPPRTPRFDWDEVGLDRATASLTERQRALLATTDPTEPYWYGYGMRSEVEAGVEPDILNVHQFVGGSTGVGKTTLLTNFFYQIMQRGHGGLFFDPKGQDAKDIVRLLPDHREEDLVFIDIGADAEYEVGFNFLEIPLEDPDPDSQAFDSAVSALADDFEALLAQSGDGSSWGPRMSGITRAVVRGLAEYQVRTDETVTMLDMAFLLADEEGRQRIHEMMGEERIEWIQQATHVIADYSEDDLEPLVRRLWEWIFSSTIRSVASHPSATISIDDIVRDGKIVVVRNSSGADTPKRLITTALIRRLWVSIREQTNRDDHPDPPQFYVVCDEFDKVVSEQSNIHNILREARSFGLSLTFAAQNLDTGGGDDIGIPESIQKAIRGNCKTFLTFDPGDPEDAKDIAHQHSKNIDGEDIEELSQFRIYMRTHDDQNDKTDSYKVRTLPPAPESLSDEKVRSDEETEVMIAESQERYGQPARSTSDIKDEMLVNATGGGTGTIDADAAMPDELDMEDKAVRNRALKVVYDESIRQDAPGEYVAVEDCLPRLRRYLPGGEEINSVGQAWRKVFQEIPDAYLADREHTIEEGEEIQTEVKALDMGFMNIGDKENDGDRPHWEQMADAYVPFTQLGFVFDIPEQTGGAMPDALAKLDDALYLDDLASDDHGKVAKRINNYRDDHAILDRLSGTQDAFIESEHSTGQTQPSQTISNLVQAHNEGHRCLFICRPGEADAIYNTVAGEEPCARDGHSVDGEKRFYTFTPDTFTIDGQEITRPGASDNVWVYDEQTGQYILRDNNGTEHARFDTAAEIYNDASAYPSDGDRGVKPPAIPEYEFEGGDASAAEWDIITVPKPERDENDDKIPLSPADLELYRQGERNVPLSDMVIGAHETEGDESSQEQTASPDTNTVTTVSTDDGSDQSEARATDGGDRDVDIADDADDADDGDSESDAENSDSDPPISRVGGN